MHILQSLQNFIIITVIIMLELHIEWVLVVKFLEVLCQQDSWNLKNISEDPRRIQDGSFLQFHHSCLNPYITQPLL